MPNVLVNLTWLDSVRSYDTALERDHERVQLDFNFRF